MSELLFFISIMLVSGIVISKASYRFGMPSLLLFLLTGILAGSDGFGGIEFDNYDIAQQLGNIALIFIMFSGGLETKISTIRPIIKEGVILSTLGVILSVFIVGGFVYWVTGFSFYESMLLGAIVSSTDAAAVFGIFRSRKMGLKHNLRPLLELESGSNDPMAFIMTTTFIYLIKSPDVSILDTIWILVRSITLGALCGWLFGRGMLWLINRIKLDTDGLYPVLSLAMSMLTFSATDIVGGNGFLAIYIAAVILGNNSFVHKKSLTRFHDGVAWLMQVVMFIMLGLLVTPSNIVPVIGVGVLVSIFMIVIARPAMVFILMYFSRFTTKDKIFISWGGLRGAVPIVFASYALVEGVPHSETIFNIVFFISIASVLVQGTLLPYMSKKLELALPQSDAASHPLDYEITDSFKSEMTEVRVDVGSTADGAKIVEMNIPHSVMVILVYRDGKYFAPKGSTKIQSGDVLTLMSENRKDVESIMMMCSNPAI